MRGDEWRQGQMLTPPPTPKRGSFRAFHDAYGPAAAAAAAATDPAEAAAAVSWRRLWAVVARERRFLGAQVYAGAAHLGLAAAAWAAGVCGGSVAAACYASIAAHDACAVLVDAVPRAVEYSGNGGASVAHPFGLQALPTVLGFANGLVLLYRAAQALREGAERLLAGREPEAPGRGAALAAAACVAAAAAMGVCSAARFANHRAAWELRARRPLAAAAATGAQNALRNPLNAASLAAALWTAAGLVLAPAGAAEPASCVAAAAAMAFIAAPTCARLGRRLLLAAPPAAAAAAAEAARHAAAAAACDAPRVWCPAHGRRAVAVRLFVSAPAHAGRLHRRVAGLLRAAGFADPAIEIRADHSLPLKEPSSLQIRSLQ
ncbi:hypothetical protein H4R18_004646 [Coemansia javaensis]|uniref:Cation efflux protein transmembrane domain-containing protein n=1 Tax=Coemansia javaensis TaxID=2761396 RepID=A0A9W8LFZ1_9FUNG|nr:hypothetical protein H4R18_004646 [Coemansia javaensis]